jgi:hypothetical protein
MKSFKKLFRLLLFTLLLLMALVGGVVPVAFRRNEMDYDNEIKTELVEGEDSGTSMSDKT